MRRQYSKLKLTLRNEG